MKKACALALLATLAGLPARAASPALREFFNPAPFEQTMKLAPLFRGPRDVNIELPRLRESPPAPDLVIHASLKPELGGKCYESGGTRLYLGQDGFFALAAGEPGSPSFRSWTGRWRLSPEGRRIHLANEQDLKLEMQAGREKIHASLGALGLADAALAPAHGGDSLFALAGRLERGEIVDSGSGLVFPLPKKLLEGMEEPAFVTVLAKAGAGGLKVERILAHSRHVPRQAPQAAEAEPDFGRDVAGRFWLLPPMPGVERAALMFTPPTRGEGAFEASGPGLRFEGLYSIKGSELTLSASKASVEDLKSIGAGALAGALLGGHSWVMRPRGPELANSNGRRIRLSGGM